MEIVLLIDSFVSAGVCYLNLFDWHFCLTFDNIWHALHLTVYRYLAELKTNETTTLLSEDVVNIYVMVVSR